MTLTEIIKRLEANLMCRGNCDKCYLSKYESCSSAYEAAEEAAIKVMKDVIKFNHCESACSDCVILDKYI